jgi:hypothetical protein
MFRSQPNRAIWWAPWHGLRPVYGAPTPLDQRREGAVIIVCRRAGDALTTIPTAWSSSPGTAVQRRVFFGVVVASTTQSWSSMVNGR